MIFITYIALWILVCLSMVGGVLSILGGYIFGMILASLCCFFCAYAMKKIETILL